MPKHDEYKEIARAVLAHTQACSPWPNGGFVVQIN